jgi:uncharacterized GH25 family protein
VYLGIKPMRATILLLLLLAAAATAGGDLGNLRGKILGPDGKPRKGLEVRAYCITETPQIEKLAKTDDAGEFKFLKLLPGRWLLEWGPIDRAAAIAELAEQLGPVPDAELVKHAVELVRLKKIFGYPHIVKVKAGEDATHNIRLPRKRTIEFIVTHAGKPLANARVKRIPLDEDARPLNGNPGKKSSATDESGTTRFDSFDDGPYAIIVLIDEWEVGFGVRELNAKSPKRIPLDMSPHSIELKLVDSLGAPVKEARVTFLPKPDWVFVRADVLRSQNGVSKVSYLPDGKYEAHASAGSAGARSKEIAVSAKTSGSALTITLPATGSIRVRVTDGAGKPIKGVHVLIRHAKGKPAFGQDTSGDGEVVVDELTAGEWRVFVQRDVRHVFDQSKPHEKSTAQIKPGKQTILDVTLR